ncbi:MAG: hypothetical protein ISN64_03820 [Rickettsia sp.]|nr:hypothetical protein [Rickettsia sp.]
MLKFLLKIGLVIFLQFFSMNIQAQIIEFRDQEREKIVKEQKNFLNAQEKIFLENLKMLKQIKEKLTKIEEILKISNFEIIKLEKQLFEIQKNDFSKLTQEDLLIIKEASISIQEVRDYYKKFEEQYSSLKNQIKKINSLSQEKQKSLVSQIDYLLSKKNDFNFKINAQLTEIKSFLDPISKIL